MKFISASFLFDDYQKHWKALFFLLLAELILVYVLTKTPLYALGDCSLYYQLAQTFWVNNGSFFNFDFLNPTYAYGINVKGYIFPLLLSFPYKLSLITGMNPEFCIQMLYIFLFILLFLFIAPTLYKKFATSGKKTKIPVISIIVFAQIFLYFWYGYLLFPLSDVPAAIFFLLGVIFFTGDKRSWYHFFIAGLFFTAAYNTRTIYLYPIIFFIIFLFFTTVFNKNKRISGLIGVCMLILAFVVLELPQLYVNINKFSAYSLMIQNGALLKLVMWFGYSTIAFVSGIDSNSAAFAKLFIFPAGEKVKISLQSASISEMLKSLLTTNIHITISGLFLKLYSSIDVWFAVTYIPEKMIDNFSSIFRNINYLIWFIGLSSIAFMKFNLKKVVLLFIVLSPSLIAYLGHVETRYFVLNFILIYIVISFWMMEEIETDGVTQVRIKAIALKILSRKIYIAIYSSSFIIFMLLFNYLHSFIFSLKV